MKPGYKTTEMWLTLLAILAASLLGSGLLVPQSSLAKVVSLVATVLAALGYTASRTAVKRAAIEAGPVVVAPIDNGGPQ